MSEPQWDSQRPYVVGESVEVCVALDHGVSRWILAACGTWHPGTIESIGNGRAVISAAVGHGYTVALDSYCVRRKD